MADELRQSAYERTPDDTARMALIERSILVLLFVGIFIGVLAVVKPFTTAILFGGALATAAWPIRQALIRRGVRRGLTATLLLLLCLVIVVLPMLVVGPNLADQMVRGAQRVEAYFAATPEQPAWMRGLPLVGRRLAAAWDRIIDAEGNLRTLLEPYTANVEQVMITAARALADSVVQMLLSLVVATMFWANGDVLLAILHDALRRLGGPIAERALDVAAGAIRGVAYGVVGTAAI
jgi:predicted PurR-regulated permease PerM